MLKTYRIRFVKMLCLAVLTSLIIPLSSCQGEDDEPTGKGKTFSEVFSERSISFSASSSTKTIYGNGNLFDYEFSTSASWLSVANSSQQLFISATTNTSSYTRSGSVNVYKKSGGLFGQIQVTQQGSINSGNQGNNDQGNNDQGNNNQGNDNQGGNNPSGNNQGGNNQGG